MPNSLFMVVLLMKAQRWGPYADVLRSETKPLNAKPQTYSNTRFGQHLKMEDARLAKASEASAKAIDSSNGAVRTGVATSITRPGSVFLDLGVHMSNPQRFADAAIFKYNRLIERLHGKGVITAEQANEAQNLLSRGKYAELDQYLKALQAAYIRGE